MEDSLAGRRRLLAVKRPDLIPLFNDSRVTVVWTDEFSAWDTHPNYGLAVVMVDDRGKTFRRAVRHGVNDQRGAIAELKEWLGTV